MSVDNSFCERAARRGPTARLRISPDSAESGLAAGLVSRAATWIRFQPRATGVNRRAAAGSSAAQARKLGVSHPTRGEALTMERNTGDERRSARHEGTCNVQRERMCQKRRSMSVARSEAESAADADRCTAARWSKNNALVNHTGTLRLKGMPCFIKPPQSYWLHLRQELRVCVARAV